MTQYRIPESNWAEVERRLVALDKKARKLGTEPPVWRKVGEEQVLLAARDNLADIAELGYDAGTTYELKGEPGPRDQVVGTRTYFLVEVTGKSPRLAGWKFRGSLQWVGEVGNIIRSIGDEDVPERFRTAEQWCDWCQTNRFRRDTFLVENAETGEWKQVGRDCLKDFTGHDSPEAVANYAQSLAAFLTDLGMERDSWGGSYEEAVSAVGFLGYVASAIRQFGWLSKSKAELEGGQPTAELARNAYFGRGGKDEREVSRGMTDEDKTDADAVLTWVRDLPEDELDSDFMWNLSVVAASDYTPVRGTNILAAAFVAKKFRDEKEARKNGNGANKASEWFGTEGKRETFRLTVTFTLVIDGYYGSKLMVKFADEAGNVAVWWNSGSDWDLKTGKTYLVTATVKSWDEYEGVKQTVLTRAKVKEVADADA